MITIFGPDCGLVSNKKVQPGKLHKTTSLLTTVSKNASELIAIEQRLKRANESAAPWNLLLGVCHV